MTHRPEAGPASGTLTKAYGILEQGQPLQPVLINRRKLDEHDICIKIKFCGICHSDLHHIRNEWGYANYPLIPGHETVGVVIDLGSRVTKFKLGDFAGVNIYDSCRRCPKCKQGLVQYCEKRTIFSFNCPYIKDDGSFTCGGFSEKTVVDENYAVKIPDGDNLDKIAPLLCAGITVFSPLKYLCTNEESRVGVVGFGGLGHLAVKIAKAMKAEVSVISRSADKKEAALKLGVRNFLLSTDESQMKESGQEFDILLYTASGTHDLNELLQLVDVSGTLVMLGVPPEPLNIDMIPVTLKRKKILGSCVGSIKETQEMLDFCKQYDTYADIDVIPVSKINDALDILAKGEISRRFVIDMSTL